MKVGERDSRVLKVSALGIAKPPGLAGMSQKFRNWL